MPRTSVSKKAHLKNLTSRLDFLKRWFGGLRKQDPPRPVTDEFVRDALDLVAQIRKAVAAKRFEAVLLYHELEDLHRRLTEDFEIPEWFNQAKRDARHVEGTKKRVQRSAEVRRDNSKKKDCLAYVGLRLREDPTIQDDFKRRTQLSKDAAKKYDVDVHEVRRWRREDAAQKLEERAARESRAARGH